jgi:NAD(P)-dependent dehydrogenase (short-subunit alcohol dehydrogenase family)
MMVIIILHDNRHLFIALRENRMHKKVALVTGASSGIGLAVAKRFLEAGYTVYGTSRKPVEAAAFPFSMLVLDVNSEASVAAAVQTLLQREGRLDVLVNNAGFTVAPAAAEESSLAQAQAIFDTNFFGLIRTTLAVLPQMQQQGQGRIINIGSVLGFLPAAYGALYVASKHAVAGYSQSLDHQVRTQGIRVLVVEPAYTQSEIANNALQPDVPLSRYQVQRNRQVALMHKMIARGDSPNTVANAVFLAANTAKPKLRYPAGKKAALLANLRRFAPASLLDAALRKDAQLDAQ